VSTAKRGRTSAVAVAPKWQNQNEVIEGDLTVLYHVTSASSYAHLEQAMGELPAVTQEREQ